MFVIGTGSVVRWPDAHVQNGLRNDEIEGRSGSM
jgi:hypothetical protein